jgi:hypothetical protein
MPEVEYEADTGEKMTSDEWCSPPEISIPLFHFWGLCGDPCSNGRSLIQTHDHYESGGLTFSWWKQTYANWPYSKNHVWADKAIYELKEGNVRELVILCMTSTSSWWWRALMMRPRRNPRVIHTEKLKFIGPDGKPLFPSRFEPALIYYGARHRAFDNAFRHVARWSTWGRSSRE